MDWPRFIDSEQFKILVTLVPLLLGMGILSGFEKSEFAKLFERVISGVLHGLACWLCGAFVLGMILGVVALIIKIFR